jgi:hypothetical protein
MDAVAGGIGDPGESEKVNADTECNMHHLRPRTGGWLPRMELRKHWLLPDESKLSYTGLDWLLILLNQLEGYLKAKVLFLLWRAWHLRNDMVHGQGTGSIMGSV